ncbi:MAG: AAA family ATPase [Hungatella sp.]|jgi:MoxR-like ATPase|nr:AAA family ATPase [Hungatella sp.]
MAYTKLFESWTFSLPLPEPFAQELANRGMSRTSSEEKYISKHNDIYTGRQSTLHGPVLRSMLRVAKLLDTDSDGALGVQKNETGGLEFYCGEFKKKGNDDRTVVVYNARTGKFKVCESGNGIHRHMPALRSGESDGRPLLGILEYASLNMDGPVFNQEFFENFTTFRDQVKNNWYDMDMALQAAFVCCDNIYRRVEKAGALGTDGIPVDRNSLASGNAPILTPQAISQGQYAPTEVAAGKFEVLFVNRITATSKAFSALGDKYRMDIELTEEEQARVPVISPAYHVSEEVQTILEMIKKTPMRTFMIRGDSGTGKSIDVAILAKALGLPYYFLTCSEGTDEMDLVSTMIPNTNDKADEDNVTLPDYEDFMMDPATVLSEYTGAYEEDIDIKQAFDRLMQQMYQNGYQKCKEQKDFVLVESDLVKACRRPSVFELQESAIIGKPGTLVKLNGLLDDCASIMLANGEVVRRNSDTVIILTTNTDYKGCKEMNESILSRMCMIFDKEELTPAQMKSRAMIKTGCKDEIMLLSMAETVEKVRQYCRKERIRGGVCGYREYESWVLAYMVQGDVLKSARSTILSKVASDRETKEEIFDTCIKISYPEALAA